jgi:general secretion pathway protein D
MDMTLLINKLIKSTKSTFYFCTLSVLFSCTNISQSEIDRISNNIIDPNSGMTRDQFKNSLSPLRKKEHDNKKTNNGSNSGEYQSDPYSEPAIPEISNILTTPTPSSVLTDKLISISVTEDIPLKDVLIELSRLADVDMEIDPGITGGIILRVTDKPFNEVIERVVDLGGLRYRVIKGTIRVERDNPYKKDYKVDYLNMTRTSSSSISVDTNGLGAGATGGGALPSGSSSSTEQTTTGDVWESIETALKNILAFNEQANVTTQADADATATSTPTANIQINKQAGLISTIATERQHKNILEYLNTVEEQVSSQVLIEAKVLEVTLDEKYKSGVDWGTLADKTGLGLAVSGNFGASISSSADFLTIRGVNSPGDMSTAISFTEQFGITRTISSPRLNAMNNQQSVLSFAENTVYFELQVEEETDEAEGGASTTTLTVDSEMKTVPVGVILALQPSINLETNEITMHVRPTMSRITGSVTDPGVDIIVARQDNPNPINVESRIPIIEVREMDSVLKIKSGEIMVIGGLMKDEQSSEDKGVPFANRTPIVGNFFKSKNQATKTVETVIFIKATIVKNNDTRSIPKFDKDYYNNFAPRDPRPLAF